MRRLHLARRHAFECLGHVFASGPRMATGCCLSWDIEHARGTAWPIRSDISKFLGMCHCSNLNLGSYRIFDTVETGHHLGSICCSMTIDSIFLGLQQPCSHHHFDYCFHLRLPISTANRFAPSKISQSEDFSLIL